MIVYNDTVLFFTMSQKMKKETRLKTKIALQHASMALLGLTAIGVTLFATAALKKPSLNNETKKIARLTAQRTQANENAVFYKILRGKALRIDQEVCVICEGSTPVYVSVEHDQEKMRYARVKPEGGIAGTSTEEENIAFLDRANSLCPVPKDVPTAHEGPQILMKRMNDVLRITKSLKPVLPKKKRPAHSFGRPVFLLASFLDRQHDHFCSVK